MTTLTLTPQPASSSVLLEIADAPAGAVVITRTDANGTGPVRLRTGQAPIAGALTLTDYEPALLGGIRYDVVDSALVTTTASTALDAGGRTQGAELRRNLATNPRAVTASGLTTNDPLKWSRTNNVAVPAPHPLGIAKCWRTSVLAGGAGGTTLASFYDPDAVGDSATSRGFGVWVYSAVAASASLYCVGNVGATQKVTTVPANTWTFCTTLAASTSFAVVIIGRQAGTVATGDVAYVTGCVSLAGAVPADFFDGDLPDTPAELYRWAGAQNASQSVAYAAAPIVPVSSPQLGGVQEPQFAYTPELITGYDSTRDAASQVLRVLGRGDPVVLLGPTRTREGTLEIWARDHAAALDVAGVLASARILMLRQPTHAGMDMYFLAQSIDVQPLTRVVDGWRWQTTCRYVEVRNPNLPLLGGAGWTFDDVAATYGSFAAVRSSFATFNDLLVGP